MNMKTESAKSALIGRGYFEMTDEGELMRLDTGRDSVLHIPKGCKKINKKIYWNDGVICFANVRFYENAVISMPDNVMLYVKPYVANKISEVIFDMSNAATDDLGYDSTWLLPRLENVRVHYIFNDNRFVNQLKIIHYIFLFTKGSGLQFSVDNGKFIAFAGLTDVSDKMTNPVILKQMRELIEKKKLIFDRYNLRLFEIAEKQAGITKGFLK